MSVEKKQQIEDKINQFSSGSLHQNSIELLKTLGYESNKRVKIDKDELEDRFQNAQNAKADKALLNEWKSACFLFQYTTDEVRSDFSQQTGFEFSDENLIDNTLIESYFFFSVELYESEYPRGKLSQITREVNKLFQMPTLILFKYGDKITFSIINRRPHKREPSKDVLEKVTLIKDINIENPHRAHIEILFDLSFDELYRKHEFKNFFELHNAWHKTLDISELNKRFYKGIANWYFWAVQKVVFPDDDEKNEEIRNATNVIRLITRLMFIWFLKEKGLVPEELFNLQKIKQILQFNDKNNSTYYKAILQNLFFSTLNTEMNNDKPGSRKFRSKAKETGMRDQHYMIHNVFRYEDYFVNPQETFEKYFDKIPFLNGGLFECLDRYEDGNNEKILIRIDGFSDRKDNVLTIPDELFFSTEQDIDLNEIYRTRNKRYSVIGLINLLNSYKFTIEENTPIEEEVALDPELLGKAFENLLASYNPETKTTARKQTGSYYTPREIVNYMVDESIKAYLQQKLIDEAGMNKDDAEVGLSVLFEYTEKDHLFEKNEVDVIIEAIDNCKILDPACGSGAYPMGILHRMVYILKKFDPENEKWRNLQRQKAIKETEEAYKIGNKHEREQRLIEINNVFEYNLDDYGRKLYLIENCIFGVDIQPIAVQIAKLRFFISLLVEQITNTSEKNLGILPLPNFETKFVAANTLIGIEISGQEFIKNIEVEKKEKELKEVRKRHFTARAPLTKEKYRKQDKQIRENIVTLLKNDGIPASTTEMLAHWDPYDQNLASPFFNKEWMFGIKDGFDVVIGNPPYVEHKKLRAISQILRPIYSTYSGTADLYVYFYESGIRLLKKNGTLVFISSNKFLKTSYGENLRKYLTDFRINEIVDFTDVHIFDALVASCIISVTRNQNNENRIKIAFANDTLPDFTDILKFVDINKFLVKQNGLNEKIWQLESENKLALKEKIELGSIRLNEIKTVKIFRGVTTGYNPAFIISEEKREELSKKNPANKVIIKPLLQGRNIRKWIYNESYYFLLQTGYNINIKNEYPSIFNHLNPFKEELQTRADQGVNWWNLRACKYYSEFEKEKIIWGLTADKWAFAYDDKRHYLPSNGYIMTSSKISLKYILALLNSQLMCFYFGFIGIMTAGGAYTLKHETVREFPIKMISQIAQQPFIDLVNEILAAKECNTDADTNKHEAEIDRMVYSLFDLTEDEIEIIENSVG